MRKVPITIAIAVLLCATLQAQQSSSNPGRSFVSFQPSGSVSVAVGRKAPVTFTFRVENGYHINSNKPMTEELIPTQLHFTLPGEIAIGKVVYPAGQLMSFPFDPTQKLSVYSGDVVIHAMVIIPQDASPGPMTVHGELKYQACDNNACYPPKKLPMSFDVKVTSGSPHRPAAHGTAQSPHIHN
jgi:DsbC/DsbD-like thiol-disulfide interchange protein